jgi:UDP-GlcNAc:undecaprenyl-phosphate/decaprenyl-phosphate GlcNAc-1-phosphate transferase
MEQIIIGGVFAFLVTFYAIPVIIQVSDAKKLYDIPDARKVHKEPIPSLGGLGMFAGFILSLLLTISFTSVITPAPEFQYYIAATIILFFVGLKDDIMDISPLKKFCGQLIVATILIFKANLVITSMHGFLGIETLEAPSSYLLSYFTIVVVVNAFNLIDGIDGLAGSIGLVSCVLFSILFLINGNIPYAVLGFSMSGALLAFLIYNYQPAKIFMGDTGSMLIGLVNVVLAIKFIESAGNFKSLPITASPAIGFGILLLPLLDTLRVFAIRIFHRRSPFSPDRNHLHHLLLDRGLSHRTIAITIASIAFVFAVVSILVQAIGTTFLICSLTATFFGGIYVLYLTKPKYGLRVVAEEQDDMEETFHVSSSPKPVKLVSIFSSTEVEEERAN